MEQTFILHANPIKMKKGGQYDVDHQINSCAYHASIKNWEIHYSTPFFRVKDSNGDVGNVFAKNYKYTFSKLDCDCDEYHEKRAGTCQHIEAVKRLSKAFLTPLFKDLETIKNYVWYDSYRENFYKSGDTIAIRTPSYLKYRRIAQEVNPYTNGIDAVVDVDMFKDYGIILKRYQVHSIKRMLKQKRTVLSLKMGLGKTLCALACIKILNPKTVLVICPNDLKYQWKEVISKYNMGSCIVVNNESQFTEINHKFVIINYTLATKHIEKLAHFEVFVADEIQKIKNNETSTWAAISKVKSDYLFALSGSPIENHVSDLISIIRILNPLQFNPLWKFYHQYCECSRAKVLGLKQDKFDEFKRIVGDYIINPEIPVDENPIPTAQEFHIKVPLDRDTMAQHDKHFSIARPLLAKSFNTPLTFSEKATLNSAITKAHQSVIDARYFNPIAPEGQRLAKIRELIAEKVRDGMKVLVYSQWIKPLEMLKQKLEEMDITTATYDGTINIKKRAKVLSEFIDEDVSVMLSTDSSGTGVDGLQKSCNVIIHVEKHFNPKRYEQRNGRLVRQLQEKSVEIYYFYSDSEVELLMSDANVRKVDLFNKIMTPEKLVE